MINRGIYLFLSKFGLSIHDMRYYLTIYAQSHGIKKPKYNRLKWYKRISELASSNFIEFKKHFNKHKKKDVVLKKESSYSEYDELDYFFEEMY
jgi:hypothetical protein